jgi:hypothetical protein
MKAAVKTPEQGKNEVECKFQGKIILKDSFKGLSI